MSAVSLEIVILLFQPTHKINHNPVTHDLSQASFWQPFLNE